LNGSVSTKLRSSPSEVAPPVWRPTATRESEDSGVNARARRRGRQGRPGGGDDARCRVGRGWSPWSEGTNGSAVHTSVRNGTERTAESNLASVASPGSGRGAAESHTRSLSRSRSQQPAHAHPSTRPRGHARLTPSCPYRYLRTAAKLGSHSPELHMTHCPWARPLRLGPCAT
jgi:hypothetical protein